MPPSPVMRFSPGRELRAESHRRGRSLEGGLLIKEKDDDLALFNDMQTREKDNFLLHSTDDLDDSLSMKLRDFSDFKLGITIPARGESSDLLHVEGDKNDYDWLLTPPDTPLFPSLDDEMPPPNLSHRGRPRSQPISISRSASTEKSYRNNRSSASPHRLSPSPRSGSGTFQSRGRTLSAPHSSPTPIRPTTPSRSPSTPPKKLSTPALGSSTPDPRRMSTGSSGTVTSAGGRGASPAKTSRGNSASPKLQAWQSNLPGFSTEAPPNLRTSLADRPASYVRGSSPASRNGRGLSPSSSNGRGLSPTSSRGLSPASRNGRESSSKRQSMSPTASRSASSSHSHDRDRLSSQSKGSVVSSGDDDIDSLQSVNVSISERSAAKKIGTFANNRVPSFTKTPSRISSSAPKRSFDSALRQMDRRSPQNMFRPLLSSVPSTTFYAGKASSVHRPMISMNSSVTTSSNTSSDPGASVVPDTEGSEHDQDRATEWGKAPYPDGEDEVFMFDKLDEINEDAGHDIHDGKHNLVGDSKGTTSEIEPGERENFKCGNGSAAIASESTCVVDEISEVGCQENMATCSKCGKKFDVVVPMEENADICPDCSKNGGHLPVSIPETSVVTEITKITSKSDTKFSQGEMNVEKGQDCSPDPSLAKSMVEEGNQHMNQQMVGQLMDVSYQAARDSADQRSQHSNAFPTLKVDASEGVGMSILLKKSSSSKWAIVQGRSLTTTNTPFDDLSYARDSTNSMRSSIGHGSASASSSVDLSSSRQTEARVQRQLSSRKTEQENIRHDLNRKPLSRGSSFSGIHHPHHSLVLDKSTSEENFDVSIGRVEFEALEETLADSEGKVRNTESVCNSSPFVRTDVPEEDKLDGSESCRMMEASASEQSSCTPSIRLDDPSAPKFPNGYDCVSFGNGETLTDNARSMSNIEAPTDQGFLPIKEDAMLSNGICGIDIVEDSTHGSSFTLGGVGHECYPGSQTDSAASPDSRSILDELYEPSVPAISEKETTVSASGSCIPDHGHDILEESTTVIVEGAGGQMCRRSLTFEEATDTILFCSSIVHSLAYKAATIGMEKENLAPAPLEGSRPTVTLLGKPNSDRKDPRGRNTSSKRSPKPQKSKQRRVVEPCLKTASSPKLETDLKKTHGSAPYDSEAPSKLDSSARPPKLESKCNCTVM